MAKSNQEIEVKLRIDSVVATRRLLRRLGADIERTTLARAVESHCEDRVLLHGSTTVVF